MSIKRPNYFDLTSKKFIALKDDDRFPEEIAPAPDSDLQSFSSDSDAVDSLGTGKRYKRSDGSVGVSGGGDPATKSTLGLNNVDNTSDANKPISNAQEIVNNNFQTELENIVGDHGDLSGNDGDDHTQYHNDSRGDVRYYRKSENDAQITSAKNRSNHTGTQLANTISDFNTVVTTLIDNSGKADQSSVNSLNTIVGNLQTLVSSDDTTLDDLQEIVDFIKVNKSTLDSLSISNIAGLQTALDNTISSVTKSDVGLGNVDNTSDANKPVSTAQATLNLSMNNAINNLNALIASDDTTLDDLQEIVDFIKVNKNTLDALSIVSIAGLQTALDSKLESVTASSIGLGNIDNTSDLNKPVSTAQATAIMDAAEETLQRVTDLETSVGDISSALDLINGEVV